MHIYRFLPRVTGNPAGLMFVRLDDLGFLESCQVNRKKSKTIFFFKLLIMKGLTLFKQDLASH